MSKEKIFIYGLLLSCVFLGSEGVRAAKLENKTDTAVSARIVLSPAHGAPLATWNVPLIASHHHSLVDLAPVLRQHNIRGLGLHAMIFYNVHGQAHVEFCDYRIANQDTAHTLNTATILVTGSPHPTPPTPEMGCIIHFGR